MHISPIVPSAGLLNAFLMEQVSFDTWETTLCISLKWQEKLSFHPILFNQGFLILICCHEILPARQTYFFVAERGQRWGPTHSNFVFLHHAVFILLLVPIQLRLNYSLLNKAAANALSGSSSQLHHISHFFFSDSQIISVERAGKTFFFFFHFQLANTQVSMNNINTTHTLEKLASLVCSESHFPTGNYTQTHTSNRQPCMHSQWQRPI